MITSEHVICRALPEILAAHGVKRVVLSPGSRNAPVITAIKASGKFRVTHVVDERSAAFVALGMASVGRGPVALVCTSGTALYNYAPALAEAFYRHIPLIAISADRPPEWIGQDDSQTLVQPMALDKVVKGSYSLPVGSRKGDIWCAGRLLNDAMLRALSLPRGPVHINLPLDEPLSGLVDSDAVADRFRIITSVSLPPDLPTAHYRKLAAELASPRKVMIVCGFMPPDTRLRKAVTRLAKMPNVAVLCENISNLWGVDGVVGNIDSTLASISPDDISGYVPDVVISVGGALVSRFLKKFLRDNAASIEHWQVGVTESVVDCFQALTRSIDVDPDLFLRGLASGMQIHRAPSDYARLWHEQSRRASGFTDSYAGSLPWCDMALFARMLRLIPADWNVEFSNGTPIRYSQLFGNVKFHSVECNRGVSGIDGSTSTALGASVAYERAPTLLVTGDMSAQYDVGALLNSGCLTPRFKMVVVANGGGSIFRFIASTRSLPDLEEGFAMNINPPFASIGSALGFRVFEVDSAEALDACWSDFAAESSAPALMAVTTSGALSADVLRNYFSSIQSINETI